MHVRAQIDVVLVGFGHAGKIHHKAYKGLTEICRVAAVVEPHPDRRREAKSVLPGVPICERLDEALKALGGEVIVDFCVPAKINLALVETALTFGVRRFLIEKPLGWDVASTNVLAARLSRCDVVYMDTYLASRGVLGLLAEIERQQSRPKHVSILFHKNRISDSATNRGFVHDAVPNAWMIEGPHMLSLARQISGEIREITKAGTFDMVLESGQVLPEHGGGHALLQHETGTITDIDLSLCSDRNERTVEVELINGAEIRVELPPSKAAKQFSTFELRYPSGKREIRRYEDRPMEYCVHNAIRHFAGEPLTVRRLSDGLAVCRLVERMMEKKQFWQSAPRQWKYFGPPLRPCSEDIEVMRRAVTQWSDGRRSTSCDALLCGVTPEIVRMHWPVETRLWAVEKSLAMIDEVWPSQPGVLKQPIQAEWTKLPFPGDSFDIVIGDGCFTSLEYPGLQSLFLESLRRVLRRDGLLIMRFFVQKDDPEAPEAVFQDLEAGRIGSFHAFKWRLAMAMQKTAEVGVRVDDIWQAWNRSGMTTPWPAHTVNTIDTYRGSDHRLTFTNLQQIRELLLTSFEERACIVPGYELGERCPIMVYSPR